MYAREINNKVHTFGVSGKLWKRSLVMYDKETGTLWSHILGTAEQGPLKGTQLEQIPSVMTNWQSWSQQHPKGTVAMLSRTSKEYRKEFYRQLDQFVLGIAEGETAKAWRFDGLKKHLGVHDTWQGKPVIVLFDDQSMTPRLYSRIMNGRTLNFQIESGSFKDKETGSTWEPVTGKALAGPLQGQHLEALPAIQSFTNVWRNFHPKSENWP